MMSVDALRRGLTLVRPGSALYRADQATAERYEGPWRPSIFMPRWASRITLEVTDVRVERVQNISPREAWAEGARCDCMSPVPMCAGNIDAFRGIWDSINAAPKPKTADGQVSHYVSYPWGGESGVFEHRGLPHHVHANPWVWAVGFKRVEVGDVE